MTVQNWTTEEKLIAMVDQGWRVTGHEVLADEGRVLVRLRHPGDRVETFRSLPMQTREETP